MSIASVAKVLEIAAAQNMSIGTLRFFLAACQAPEALPHKDWIVRLEIERKQLDRLVEDLEESLLIQARHDPVASKKLIFVTPAGRRLFDRMNNSAGNVAPAHAESHIGMAWSVPADGNMALIPGHPIDISHVAPVVDLRRYR